jgi:hypothetical protein
MDNATLKKTCQRCGGNLTIEQDCDGVYVSCLQCGYVHDMGGQPATPPVAPNTKGGGRHRGIQI